MHRVLPTQRAYALPWSPHGAQTPTPPSRPGAEPGVPAARSFPAGTHPAWPLPSGPCCRAHSAPHGCGTRTRALRSSGKRVKESGAPGSPLGPRSPEPLPFLGTADRIPRPPCYSGAATYSEDGQQKKRGREAHRPRDPATPHAASLPIARRRHHGDLAARLKMGGHEVGAAGSLSPRSLEESRRPWAPPVRVTCEPPLPVFEPAHFYGFAPYSVI